MTYFIAWVVIGVCCYYIGKNRRDRYLPRFHLGMLYLQRTTGGIKLEITPQNVVLWSKTMEVTVMFIEVIIAPVALIFNIKHLFEKGPSESILRMKSCCDEFSKRNGITF